DLPDQVCHDYNHLTQETPEQNDSLRAWSSRYVRLVLDRCSGNKRRACDILNISYHTLRAHLSYDAANAGVRKRRVPATREDRFSVPEGT
ncbi:MAG: helix-turn-helix domain-containing protein, partial [Acidobacteriota bacterium]